MRMRQAALAMTTTRLKNGEIKKRFDLKTNDVTLIRKAFQTEKGLNNLLVDKTPMEKHDLTQR